MDKRDSTNFGRIHIPRMNSFKAADVLPEDVLEKVLQKNEPGAVERERVLDAVVSCVSYAYKPVGIKTWFTRRTHSALNYQSPVDLLSKSPWKSTDQCAAAVLIAAKQLAL